MKPVAAGATGGDLYFEAGYSFKYFGVHVGAGDGWHTTTGNFEVVNIGLTAAKEIQITDKFSLPVSWSSYLEPANGAVSCSRWLSF